MRLWTRSRTLIVWKWQKPKSFCIAGDGRREWTRKGCEVGELSTTRHIHCNFFCWWGRLIYPKRITSWKQCRVCAGPRSRLECQHWLFYPCLSSHHVFVSNTDAHFYFRENVESPRGARTDVEKWALCLGCWWCLQCQRGTRHRNEAKRTFFPHPCLRRPSSGSQCCFFMGWLTHGFISRGHTTRQALFEGLGHYRSNKTKTPAL